MGIWDDYASRLTAMGGTRRGAMLQREKRLLNNRLDDSLSYHSVTVDINAMNVSTDISTQTFAIVDSDNLNEKYIYSLPNQTLVCGSLITWMNNRWIVTELDANSEVRSKGIMTQCNHLLKWKDSNGTIQEQWVIVDDGTKLKSLVSAQWKLCA